MSKKFARIYVEITNYCNLSCSFCSKDTREKREMTIDEFRDVAIKIKDYRELLVYIQNMIKNVKQVELITWL